MLLKILNQLNWVDFLVLTLLVRILYVAAKNGFVVELFKFLGIIATTYICLHYYTALSDFLRNYIPKDNFPLEFLDFLSFVCLGIVTYLIFVCLRNLFFTLVKMEAVPTLSKWGGFILGLARGFLTVSLIIFALVISSVSYLNTSVQKSYSGRRLFNVTVSTYTSIWDGVMSKFMTNEKFNKTVTELQKDYLKE